MKCSDLARHKGPVGKGEIPARKGVLDTGSVDSLRLVDSQRTPIIVDKQ
jgi:hypothetical protein